MPKGEVNGIAKMRRWRMVEEVMNVIGEMRKE